MAVSLPRAWAAVEGVEYRGSFNVLPILAVPEIRMGNNPGLAPVPVMPATVRASIERMTEVQRDFSAGRMSEATAGLQKLWLESAGSENPGGDPEAPSDASSLTGGGSGGGSRGGSPEVSLNAETEGRLRGIFANIQRRGFPGVTWRSAGLPNSVKYLNVPLKLVTRPGAASYIAKIRIGTMGKDSPVDDPNLAATFVLVKSVGALGTTYSSPISLEVSAETIDKVQAAFQALPHEFFTIKENWSSRAPIGGRAVPVGLENNAVDDGYEYHAEILAGPFTVPERRSDPNKAPTFRVVRSGGVSGARLYSSPVRFQEAAQAGIRPTSLPPGVEDAWEKALQAYLDKFLVGRETQAAAKLIADTPPGLGSGKNVVSITLTNSSGAGFVVRDVFAALNELGKRQEFAWLSGKVLRFNVGAKVTVSRIPVPGVQLEPAQAIKELEALQSGGIRVVTAYLPTGDPNGPAWSMKGIGVAELLEAYRAGDPRGHGYVLSRRGLEGHYEGRNYLAVWTGESRL